MLNPASVPRSMTSRYKGLVKEVLWFGNGVDADYFAPHPGGEKRFTAVFVGAMDYWANIDAIGWFMRDIWPAVRASKTDATLAIVGSNPAREISALDGVDGVTVTGRVEDVRPFVAGADVVVAPMRIARGVQNKVLEAMAMGKAVVTTPAGLEGIDGTMGTEAIAVASPDGFAREILRLADEGDASRAIGAAARARILADYLWPAQMKRFDDVLDELIAA